MSERALRAAIAPLLPDAVEVLELGRGEDEAFPLPYESRRFDAVVGVHVLERAPDPYRVLAEVARVLRSGGTAVFVAPNRRALDPLELRVLCGSCFDDVRMVGLHTPRHHHERLDAHRARAQRLRLVPRPLRERLLPSVPPLRPQDVVLREDDPHTSLEVAAVCILASA